MKIKLLFFLLSLIPVVAFSQSNTLKILRGIVVSDSLQVERITVTNVTAGTYSITNDLGQFSIFAKEGDVVVFSGVAFETKEITLKALDFQEMIFKVKLNIQINELDEVKIGPFKLTGDLVYDSQRIKVKPSFKVDIPKIDLSNIEITGVKARVENSAMPNINKPLNGIDFVKVGGMIAGLFKSENSDKNQFKKSVSSEEFIVVLKRKFSDKFFIETLKIDEDKIGLFFKYCETSERQQNWLLEPQNGLALVDYLFEKSEEFNKLK